MQGKRIFIAPLDWGLGHATRCVPLIRGLLLQQNQITIGVTPLTKPVFDEEFPDLPQLNMPAYNIRYSRIFPLWLHLLLKAPQILQSINAEKKFLNVLVQNQKFDVVISDNRFGLNSKKCHTIFITHQLFLKTPVFLQWTQAINRHYILKFNEVWVPDIEEETKSLSGYLSHGAHYHPMVKYIGPQSRLGIVKENIKYDYLFLLSGPEPDHSNLARQLLQKASEQPSLRFALCSQLNYYEGGENVSVFFRPDSNLLSEIIAQSRVIVCRSGYSTLMDLFSLGKNKLILIPTKGQAEQEYLAARWEEKFRVKVIQEDKIQATEWLQDKF